MQRRQVEFIKKRVLLLEKALNAEYQKEIFGDEKSNEIPADDMETESKVVDVADPSFKEICSELIGHLPRIDLISPKEIAAAACDDKPQRLNMAQLYNKMCNVLEENVHDSVEAYLASKPVGFELRKSLLPVESIYQDICQILSPVQQNSSGAGPSSSTPKQDDHIDGAEVVTETNVPAEAQTGKGESAEPTHVKDETNSPCDIQTTGVSLPEAKPASTNGDGDEVEMEEAQHVADSGPERT